MNRPKKTSSPTGSIGYVPLWLLAVPRTLLLGLYFLRGCP